MTSLAFVDANKDHNLRIEVSPHDITESGFKIKFRTWADTQIHNCSASWMAVGMSQQ